jgi:hypothetical protein|tara:strand:- start:101 stop:253 length:153 start_codon:yes stop_codon:yes gene_type:complete
VDQEEVLVEECQVVVLEELVIHLPLVLLKVVTEVEVVPLVQTKLLEVEVE